MAYSKIHTNVNLRSFFAQNSQILYLLDYNGNDRTMTKDFFDDFSRQATNLWNLYI